MAPQDRATAHARFQEIAFAYAILSDERRRKRYDTTGNTSESLDLDDDDFNWTDFYREQWVDAVTGESINKLKTTYQGSDEEKRDVLEVYKSSEGNLNTVFQTVMLSNPLDDEERYRAYIDKAVADGEVEAYEAYTNESARKKERRHEKARREAMEAEEYAKNLGVYEELFQGKSSRKRKGKGDDEAGLAALIQQRSKKGAANFLDSLEAKYAGGAKGKKKGKNAPEDEPPEEAFEKTAARAKKRKANTTKAKHDDEVEEDLGEDDEDDEDDEVAEDIKPARKRSKRVRK